MKKRNIKATHTTRRQVATFAAPKAARIEQMPDVEPFAIVAARLGAALADVVEHEDCPGQVVNLIGGFYDEVKDELGSLRVELRAGFPALISRLAK